MKNQIRYMAYGNNIYVSAIYAADSSSRSWYLAWSENRIAWTKTSAMTLMNGKCGGLVFANSAFYTVMDGKIYKSSDGKTWSQIANSGVEFTRFEPIVCNDKLFFVDINGSVENKGSIFKLTESEDDLTKVAEGPDSNCTIQCVFDLGANFEYPGLLTSKIGLGSSYYECKIYTYDSNGEFWNSVTLPTLENGDYWAMAKQGGGKIMLASRIIDE